jgi:hypothetical protein
MSSNLHAADVRDLLGSVVGAASGEVFVVNPNTRTLEALIETLDGSADVTVRLLADRRTLKDTLDDFLVGSVAADLIEQGRLELRQHDAEANTLVVTEDRAVAVVIIDGQVAGLVDDDGEFVDGLRDELDTIWAEAEEFGLRTPPISRVRESLTAEIGPETADDFDDVLASLETARGDGDGLDEVTVSLLVAAKNEQLLYDISKWGEDVGIASKATFSRTKTRLEEMGLLDTEKVPIDVGRPRLRLVLGDERLRNASSREIASVAQSLLAS